jgi:hypothetical protein
MPFYIRKKPRTELYWVYNKRTGERYSKDALEKDVAIAQMKALYANTGESEPNPKVKHESKVRWEKGHPDTLERMKAVREKKLNRQLKEQAQHP